MILWYIKKRINFMIYTQAFVLELKKEKPGKRNKEETLSCKIFCSRSISSFFFLSDRRKHIAFFANANEKKNNFSFNCEKNNFPSSSSYYSFLFSF